jgi:DNA-binding response OmpR family regulator
MDEKNKKENLALRTVLVVEDEAPLQDAIKLKLKKEGVNYFAASTAEAALDILKNESPDLIWLDLLLPGMGGFSFLKQIRQQPKWQSVPVVIVSVSASPEKIRQAFELNVLDYLVKSQYQLSDIVRRVKVFLK